MNIKRGAFDLVVITAIIAVSLIVGHKTTLRRVDRFNRDAVYTEQAKKIGLEPKKAEYSYYKLAVSSGSLALPLFGASILAISAWRNRY